MRPRKEHPIPSVLIVESDQERLRERAEQLLMDGYEVDAVARSRRRGSSSPERPDALVLCNAGTEPETIGLLRQLRAGEIARADPRCRCWSSAPTMTRRRCATTAPVPTSRFPHIAHRCWWPPGSSRSPDAPPRASTTRSCASEPNRRLRRPHRGGRRAAGEPDPPGVRPAADARQPAAQDVYPRRADPRGVGL